MFKPNKLAWVNAVWKIIMGKSTVLQLSLKASWNKFYRLETFFLKKQKMLTREFNNNKKRQYFFFFKKGYIALPQAVIYCRCSLIFLSILYCTSDFWIIPWGTIVLKFEGPALPTCAFASCNFFSFIYFSFFDSV